MSEFSRRATGIVQSTGGAALPVYLPFVPDFVQIWNLARIQTPTSQYFPWAMWNTFMAPGDAIAKIYNTSTLELTTTSLYPTGITPLVNGISTVIEQQIKISGITKASNAQVTTSVAHGYSVGDVVIFEGLYQSPSTGMPQLSGMLFEVVTVSGDFIFTINWNTNQSNYTALVSPASSYVRRIKNPFVYSPRVCYISNLTLGASTTVALTAQHNMYVGQQIAFRLAPPWGAIQLNSLVNRRIPSSPVYGTVISVVDSLTVIVDIDSSSFIPFTSNVSVSQIKNSLTPPQMIPVGNVNSSGWPLSATSALYPSPNVNGVDTVNGPSIENAFVNNTNQGFIIGTDFLNGTNAGEAIMYEARLHDYSSGFLIQGL